MPEITDLLNRRSDLSTFVVHLTRDTGGRSAKDNLRAILATNTIQARTSMGWTGTLTASQKACMKVVCFSETPLEHVYSLFADIPHRRIKLSSYGVAFTKRAARLRGANPVWYVDMSHERTGNWEIAKALDQVRDEAKGDARGFCATPAAKVLPFIEQMFVLPGRTKEFWWEREWRHLGDFTFDNEELALVLCPQSEVRFFRRRGYAAIDPNWSLERMIAELAGLPASLTTPFSL